MHCVSLALNWRFRHIRFMGLMWLKFLNSALKRTVVLLHLGALKSYGLQGTDTGLDDGLD